MMFQFHFGSIQTQGAAVLRCVSAEFQFHFGSIQTTLPARFDHGDILVSIPLWFDSNCTASAVIPRPSAFQFHFGSIQTRGLRYG